MRLNLATDDIIISTPGGYKRKVLYRIPRTLLVILSRTEKFDVFGKISLIGELEHQGWKVMSDDRYVNTDGSTYSSEYIKLPQLFKWEPSSRGVVQHSDSDNVKWISNTFNPSQGEEWFFEFMYFKIHVQAISNKENITIKIEGKEPIYVHYTQFNYVDNQLIWKYTFPEPLKISEHVSCLIEAPELDKQLNYLYFSGYRKLRQ